MKYIDDDRLFLVAEEREEDATKREKGPVEGRRTESGQEGSKKNAVVGLAVTQPFKCDAVELMGLAVAHEARGKGIGKLLLDAIKRRADELGKGYVFFWAPADKTRTLNFYRKRGLIEGTTHIGFALK